MYALFENSKKNKVKAELITIEEARKIEPLLKGYGKEAIWSPTTSVVDPKYILKHMVK